MHDHTLRQALVSDLWSILLHLGTQITYDACLALEYPSVGGTATFGGEVGFTAILLSANVTFFNVVFSESEVFVCTGILCVAVVALLL